MMRITAHTASSAAFVRCWGGRRQRRAGVRETRPLSLSCSEKRCYESIRGIKRKQGACDYVPHVSSLSHESGLCWGSALVQSGPHLAVSLFGVPRPWLLEHLRPLSASPRPECHSAGRAGTTCPDAGRLLDIMELGLVLL